MADHIPVMLDEVIASFRDHAELGDRPIFVDATLGGGGHARAVLENFPTCELIGFDQDEQAREIARRVLDDYIERVTIVAANFCEIEDRVSGSDKMPNCILFDLGVSNMQLTTPDRGFSFNDDGPLDMRMNGTSDGITAKDIIESEDVRELTRIFKEYGEERFAYRIASGIVRERERGEIPRTTGELSAMVRRILPAPVQRKAGGHPARRVFQALRIAVNGELDVLNEGLEGGIKILAPGGVMTVISYHSLEDRIVKRTFMRWEAEEIGRRAVRKAMTPSDDEIERNRSARSAKMRVFRKRVEQ